MRIISRGGRMTSRPEIVPVILAGGRGRRLWPLTSPKRPKPFLSLRTGLSLFQRTVLRARCFAPPVIVCHEDYRALAERDLARIKTEPRTIIAEPAHRNTAAAIAMAAFHLKGQGLLMLVLPSDHVLKNVRGFEKAVIESLAYTIEHMVLLGVKPSEPETSYGYIVTDPSAPGACRPVRVFVEKPDAGRTQALIEAGSCLWNTGMFLTRPGIFLQALERASPELYQSCLLAYEGRAQKDKILQPDAALYSEIESVSVDYAVMEKASSCYAREMDVEWSDVGTWRRLLKWRWSERGGDS